MTYRNDIDGLRAIAVIAVILFHLGYLPNGYLGVDIFFVISGYLITSIVYRESSNGKFSIQKFYERRLRRIIPLLLFITGVAFILGIFLMLPDDLENLSQSVFASNLSVNNILMYITSSDYWAVKNDYKPLMHTWSLGIEEQFYLLYPLLFYFFSGQQIRYASFSLILLSILSLGLFFFEGSSAAKFYFLQHRFFELAIGGLSAIYLQTIPRNRFSLLGLYASLILLIVLVSFSISTNDFQILLITVTTSLVLVLGKTYFDSDRIYISLSSNRIISLIGKISFSLYMWHQLIFAFARYSIFEEISSSVAILLIFLTFIMSLLTYYFIENPFRNKQLIDTKKLLLVTTFTFFLITGSSFYLYSIGGIITDYPSLDLYREKLPDKRNFLSSTSNIHIQYNENVRKLDKEFEQNQPEKKVLIIGNSFGRDVANIMLEYDEVNSLQVRYFDINRSLKDSSLVDRIRDASVVFLVAKNFIDRQFIGELEDTYKVDFNDSKFWMIGTKDFGYSNGIHYSRLNENIDFTNYYTGMKKDVQKINDELEAVWGDKFINLINLISNEEGRVLVFTPDGKFISQDTVHLTKSGAKFFASLLQNKLDNIFHCTESSGKV